MGVVCFYLDFCWGIWLVSSFLLVTGERELTIGCRSVGQSAVGRVKLLSAAGSAAVLFNGIKESWRLAQENPVTVQVVVVSKCFWY